MAASFVAVASEDDPQARVTSTISLKASRSTNKFFTFVFSPLCLCDIVRDDVASGAPKLDDMAQQVNSEPPNFSF